MQICIQIDPSDSNRIIGRFGVLQSLLPNVYQVDDTRLVGVTEPCYNPQTQVVASHPDARGNLISKIKASIDSERIRRSQLPIVLNGTTFQADSESTTNMAATLTLASNGVAVPDPIGWRDASNITQQISTANLRLLSHAIFQRAEALYEQAWALKDGLAGLSQSDLEAYDLSQRWPA